jgi:two-component system sensor histidine kinase UhpB
MEQIAIPTALRPWRERLLSLPIFYKVLVANSIIVVGGAVAGTVLTLHAASGTNNVYALVALFVSLGTLASILVNWVVLRAALQPLSVLERTVDQVRRGNFSVRAQKATFSDPSIDALTDTFNGMLDTIERYRDRLHELSMRVVTAQEEERKRISRELHDGTAQALTAQLLRLKTIEATGKTLDSAVLADLIEMTAIALEEVRHMAHELRPPSLDDLGLYASLEGLADQCAERFGLPVRFHAERGKRRLSPDIELAIYRIVHGALTNVVEHAGATYATVSMKTSEESVEVRIADNGQGFDPTAPNRRSGRGLGIFGMQERASLVGGKLIISSAPNQGTTVRLIVPLSNRGGRMSDLSVEATTW